MEDVSHDTRSRSLTVPTDGHRPQGRGGKGSKFSWRARVKWVLPSCLIPVETTTSLRRPRRDRPRVWFCKIIYRVSGSVLETRFRRYLFLWTSDRQIRPTGDYLVSLESLKWLSTGPSQTPWSLSSREWNCSSPTLSVSSVQGLCGRHDTNTDGLRWRPVLVLGRKTCLWTGSSMTDRLRDGV